MIPQKTVSGWKKVIFVGSRSQRTLAQICIGILVVGAGLGLAFSRNRKPPSAEVGDRILARAGLPIEHDDDELDRLDPTTEPGDQSSRNLIPAIEAEIADPQVDFSDWFHAVPQFAAYLQPPEYPRFRTLLARRFTPAQTNLLLDYSEAWATPNDVAYQRIQAAAEAASPAPWTNFAFARIEQKRRNFAVAAQAFGREAELTNSLESRFRKVHLLLKAGDFEGLAALQHDSRYQRTFTPYVSLEIAAARRDWVTMLKLVPQVQFDGITFGAIMMSVLVGCAWAFFLCHLGEWPKFSSPATAIAAAAIVCGIISTLPTFYTITLEEHVFHAARGDDPLHIALYYIAGVGVREEACKLLLFIPLLPFLLRRDNELEALVIASFVGLGFAIAENVGYFINSAAASTSGRFLTANFFHMTLTGLNGLALYRACRWGVRGFNEFAWIFPFSIVAHGAYDALQDMPQLSQGGYIAIAVFVGFSFLFFERAHELRQNVRMTVSLTAAFLVGLSVVAAALIGYVIANLGVSAGMSLATSELIGSAVLVFMFIRAFNEPLAA